MGLNASDPAAKDGAGVSLATNAPAYSAKPVEKQASARLPVGVTQQIVVGPVGPIHLVGSPRVVVERHPTRAFVWVDNPIWGWPPALREFLNPNSPTILKYAFALAEQIKDAAEKQEARLARIVEARKREAEARRAKWESRK